MERRAAGFIVFKIEKKQFLYLLLQASYGSFHWSPPKGHVDKGETDLETAYRETEEEAGLVKHDLKVLESFSKVLKYNVEGTPKTVVYWPAELLRHKSITLSSEHKDFKWVNLKTAFSLCEHEDFKKLLNDCETFLENTYKK